MDRRYLPTFVPKVLRAMEVGSTDPYKAGFAGGESGLSFGRTQNDVAANRSATRTFYDILNNTKVASGLSDLDIVLATLTGDDPWRDQGRS